MINANLIFIFFAGIAFLGFILNALFDRIKVASILPLMLIGLTVGPLLNLVAVGQSSIIPVLTPFITAIAISFILFDVGLNMDFGNLAKVIGRTSFFTFSLVSATALLLTPAVLFIFRWGLLESLIFSLAIAGPSSVIVPTLMRVTKISKDLKTAMLYESISSDIVTFMLPLVLIGFIGISGASPFAVASTIFYDIFGSVILGCLSAVFWLYILNRFPTYSRNYSWMLTISMVVATYGLAQELALNGAITSFIFGLILANIGMLKSGIARNGAKNGFSKYIASWGGIKHIKGYQSEIVFFVSTFFFVYIGLLFNISQINYGTVISAILISVLILMTRYLFIPMIKGFMSKDDAALKADSSVATFNVARGITPAIIATVPLSLGIIIPYFLDQIFLIILITNIISTAGILLLYRPVTDKAGRDASGPGGAAPSGPKRSGA